MLLCSDQTCQHLIFHILKTPKLPLSMLQLHILQAKVAV